MDGVGGAGGGEEGGRRGELSYKGIRGGRRGCMSWGYFSVLAGDGRVGKKPYELGMVFCKLSPHL